MKDEIKEQVVLGNDAEEFVLTELGKKILDIAKRDVEEAVTDFAAVDASDLAKVRELQLRIRMGSAFPKYLIELIDQGREAMEAYKQQQEG